MTSIMKANRQTVLVAILAALSMFGLAVALLSAYKQSNDNGARQADTKRVVDQLRHDLVCVETYANAQYQRSLYIQEYLQPRNDAFANLELAIALNRPQATIDQLRRVFIAADSKYRQVSADSPLPAPPQFVCEGLTPPAQPNGSIPVLPSASPTASRGPGSPPAATTARPVCCARPVPPMTRTAPRGTATAPATRTVTRTAPAPSPSPSSSPPKGLVGPIPGVGPIVCATGLPAASLPLVCN